MSFPRTIHINNWFLFPLLTASLIICLTEGVEVENEKHITNVGAIINVNSRIGKEQRAAMEIAAESFNNQTNNTHELILHFPDSGRGPFLAATAAEELIKKKKELEVIVGMETWQEAALVADHVGNQSQVIPVISFAAPPITPPLIQRRWPFLIRMASNGSAQMKCIADIVSAYNWKRVVVIYEDDGYGGDVVGLLALLSEALQDGDAKIEHHLVLPRVVSSMSNPNWTELEELLKLPTFQSRVFIVLQASLPTVTNLFRVAKKMGLVGRESAWIITESISSLLDPQDKYDMGGTLGIKTYYDNKSSAYKDFQKDFQAKYAEEKNSTPGIYALRAYDVISILTQAISGMPSNTTNTSLQESLATLLSNYTGLSGKMQFERGEVLLDSPRFRIINIVDGKTEKELNIWTPGFGFSNQSETRSSDVGHQVFWPGNLKRAPKGWGMPTAGKPMKIGVPVGNKHFNKFVNVESNNSSDEKTYDGFCIQLFYMVLSHLNYHLPYEFEEFDGSYDDLVEEVYNKTLFMLVMYVRSSKYQQKNYDAAVGDITILAGRMEKVEFTQPYMESGLSIIVLEKYDDSTWMFMKPFTWQMWVVIGVILLYTTLIVWFFERSSNPELFDGPLKHQIVPAIWFTFSSLFFAHRETVRSNFGRVVFAAWLFVVLILNSSYTANLSSMLTTQRPTIGKLQRDNATVGYGRGPFPTKYLLDNYGINNIISVGNEDSYTEAFKSKNISALFLELPYAEVFMSELCEGYTSITAPIGFGGLSFIFQKGSPIAKDFSKAILELLENGYVRQLRNELLTPQKVCSNNNIRPKSLRLSSFSAIYVICGATSTLCFLLSLANRVKFHQQDAYQGNTGPSDKSLWKKMVRPERFYRAPDILLHKAPTLAGWCSQIRWEYSPAFNSPETPLAFTPGEIECVTQR